MLEQHAIAGAKGWLPQCIYNTAYYFFISDFLLFADPLLLQTISSKQISDLRCISQMLSPSPQVPLI
ncbi:hypothetical protein GMES_1442 [Paraglaciecola mesophila KMM 241]|jgi:hypothetical protein|uniref:Uncharacterized protein n=1 Tax=Paraglaciecola mesophila KMM 241 TaxID=1128912 RepID=K6YIC8_9ALTE|nr:hypothetical protein GMES_1442 [Paraglaciecola mesophila KMM 241]